MCGVCGIIGTHLDHYSRKAFGEMMYISGLRGWDGAGVIKIVKETATSKGTLYYTEKSDAPVYDFLMSPQYEKLLNKPGYNQRALIGHTRASTVGSNTVANTHPFTAKKAIGMHNGTLKFKLKGYEKFGTDSEGLINSISDHGIAKTLESMHHSDAFVLLWFDLTDSHFHIIRNNQRPLWFATTACNKFIYNSMPESIELVASRNRFEIKDLLSLKPYTMLSFDIFNGGKYEETDLIKHKPVAPAPPIVSYHTSPGYYYDGFDWDAFETPKQTPKGSLITNTKKFFFGWDGTQVSRADMGHILKRGCVLCEVQPKLNDEVDKEIRWIEPNVFVCSSCGTKDWVNTYIKENEDAINWG